MKESNFLEKYFGTWIEGKPPGGKAVMMSDGENVICCVVEDIRDENPSPLGYEEVVGHFSTVNWYTCTHWMPVRLPNGELPN